MSVLRTSILAALPLVCSALVSNDMQSQSLRGSRAKVDAVYSYAVNHKLYFYETSRGVKNAAQKGRLVRLTGNKDYQLHNVGHPYVKETARLFVERLAAQYHKACGEPMVVTSAIRPATKQPANSVERSVHPTGMAVDLRKPSGACLTWLRKTLISLDEAGVIDATEESRPPHFHVAVYLSKYDSYLDRDTEADAQDDELPPIRLASRKGKIYPVRKGDTLWQIAKVYGTDIDSLMRANNLASPRIKAGQKLIIPAAQ